MVSTDKITDPEKWSWKKFIEDSKKARPDPYMKELWDTWMVNGTRIILTARHESLRELTYVWLKRNLTFSPEADLLIMMPDELAKAQERLMTMEEIDDLHAKYKSEKLEYLQKEYNIEAFYDDNPRACSEANALGIRTFQVRL